MNKEIEGYLSQLDDEDPELRKVAISNLSQKDFKSLDEEDLGMVKSKVASLMEDSNLTIRYFAKKVLKSCDSLLAQAEPAEAVTRPAEDDDAMLWGSEKPMAKPDAMKPSSEKAEKAKRTETELLVQPHAQEKEEKKSLAAAVEVSDAPIAPKPSADKQKPQKKIEAKKSRVEAQYISLFARFAAVINLLIFLGFNYETLHFKVVSNSFPKVIAGDLMGQVLFGSLAFFGLITLLLRSRVSLLGISKLAASLTIAELSFAASYPLLMPKATFHGPEIFGFGIEFLTPAIPLICFMTIAAFSWEDSDKYKPVKALYTLLGVYACITPAFFAATSSAMPMDPMVIDGANLPGIAIIPQYLRPVYVGVHLFLPLMIPVIAMKLLYSLFSGKFGRFIYLLLVLTMVGIPMAAGFYLYPNSSVKIFNVKNAIALCWVKVHQLTGAGFLAPPEWTVEAAMAPLPWSEEAPAADKPADEGEQGAGKGTGEPESKTGEMKVSDPKTGKTADDASGSNAQKPEPKDLLPVPTARLESLNDVRPFMLERVETYLKARNNMLSKEDYLTFKSAVSKDFADRMAGIVKPGSKEAAEFEAIAESVLKEKLGIFFDDSSQLKADIETGKPGCRVNIQVLNGAVESYNFNQPSEAQYMRTLDYNLLYPRHLTDGIPKCPSGGVYSLDDKSHLTGCSIHGRGN